MAPIVLPYLALYRVRGKLFAYYRRHGNLVRLRGEAGSPEFLAAYQAAHAAAIKLPTRQSDAALGTFRALVEEYRVSPSYTRLAAVTRADYDRLLTPLVAGYGDKPVDQLPRSWILAQRDALAATPRKANKLVAVLRLLLAFAVDREMRRDNPALRIRAFPKGPGHRIWTPDELAAMTGEKAGAVALPVLIAYHTAQRLTDVLRLLWSAYDGQTIRLRQSKTSQAVSIPIQPELRRVLDAMPRTAAVICLTITGRPWKRDHFEHRFASVRDALGLSKEVHFHGLRHTRLTELSEAGSSEAEIAAVSGHRSGSMVAHYTRTASRERLATAAITRLSNAQDARRSGKSSAPAKKG